MNYSGIIYDDTANGIKVRTSLFVAGCRNHCPGCFNIEQQDFNYGEPFTEEVQNKILDSIDDDYHDGISILGGEPMEPENAEALYPFLVKFREKFGDTKTIWIYTGYDYDEIVTSTNARKKILLLSDILVDGPFIESQKDITLSFRGSSNQRIIDIKKSIDANKIILKEEYYEDKNKRIRD